MNAGTSGEATGTQQLSTAASTLQPAQQYYQNLLTAGRTETAASAAPAINAQLQGADAARRQQATTGTGRTGGTAETNTTAATGTQSNIDNIINTTLQTGKQTGAQGLTQVAGAQAQIGSSELANAISELGLSSTAVNAILNNSTTSRGQSFDISQQEGAALGSLITAGLGI